MLIIFGVRPVARTVGEGTFFCPHEGGDRSSLRRTSRNWFTLFFIPVIPLKQLDEYVECTGCGRAFDPAVLSAPTTRDLEDAMSAAVRSMILAVVSAGAIDDPARRQAAREVINRHSDLQYTAEQLNADLAALDTADLEARLTAVRAGLGDHGKEALLTGCLETAATDGSLDGGELAIVTRIGAGLGMTRAHVRGVIETVRERLGV